MIWTNLLELADGEIFGNGFASWLFSIAIFAITFLALCQAQVSLRTRFQKAAENSEASFERLILSLINVTHIFFFFVLALYPACLWLTFPARTTNMLSRLGTVALLVQAGSWGARVIKFFIYRHLVQRRGESKALLSAMHLMVLSGEVVVWTLVALLVIQNLGFNITALVTGLGISGVAVALAVQSILKDLFASLSIVLDRPFEVGDAIAIGDVNGVVDRIGLKTTRLRGVNGEELIFSNSALLEASLRNFRTVREKRHVFTVPFGYNVPPDYLARALEIIEHSVRQIQSCRLESVVIKTLAPEGIVVEVVYFAVENDIASVNLNQQSIYMEILKGLHSASITPGHAIRAALVGARA
jgi:small-conductance mechanosensitive channel